MSSAVLPSSFRLLPPSPTYSAGYPARYIPPPLNLKKVQETSLADGTALYTGGLRTPPAETTMSTAYQHPIMANTYDSHVALARQPATAMPTSRTAGALRCDATANPFSRTQSQPHHHSHHQHQPTYHQQQQQQTHTHTQTQTQTQTQSAHSTSTLAPQPTSVSSRHSTRPSTPASTGSLSVHSEGTVSKRESTMVMHSLQLPHCISPRGGSLDDFAAQMTCFFWFETMDTIYAAEQIKTRRSSEPIPALSKYTEPCPAYKKWVHSILSTTQVTQNVVLLALLFVYRLKRTNPKVNGNPGSEYRLLTVALMLGNKFLDDNTYTNKTWAEVSGISVKEIHVMEVEFLSNMRYGLLTSKEQWQDWLKKLACYHEYCGRAKMEERARQAQPAPVTLSPTGGRFTSPLPSPTNVLPSTVQMPTPALAAAYSPSTAIPNHHWPSNYHPTPSVSPLSAKPSLGYPLVRKRSLEGSDAVEPAAKRLPRQPTMTMAHPNRPAAASESVRLPVPHLTLDTSQAVPLPASASAYPSTSFSSQPVVSLPPLGAGVRAMSTVYPTTTTSWAPQGPIQATCGPQTPSYVMPSNFGTPTKRHSPSGMAAFGSSPLAEPFAAHTPVSNSPSVYLQQRASPYKPVRRVNTLLNPPPSIPLSEYHLGSSQMHYQPLGRRNDLRSGIVPEFLSGYGSLRTPTSQQQQQQNYH
ncbi:hypothetical protein F5X96DRAFT_141242 [Biscogniauxia mediterranea]|nr:hypothetical protein F5X96DRAFT_141242 [Biscogniauxia mediterranea]